MPHREPSQDQPPRKPSNWWAFEREPWKRVNAEIMAGEKAAADKERAARALRSAFAGAALALAKTPPLAPADRAHDREPVGRISGAPSNPVVIARTLR
jgi:hypothetical protein